MPSTSTPDPGPSPDAAPAPTSAHRRRLVVSVGVLAALVLVIDQVTKAWALRALEEGVRTPVLGDLLGIQLLFNPGAALGLATGTTWLLTLVALVVVVVIIRVARRLGSRGWTVALGLLLGGALGNLVDRVIREPGIFRGHVVDFIAYGDLFVGNVADVAIVAAAALLMLLSLRGVRLDGTREGRTGAPTPEVGADLPAAGSEPAEARSAVPVEPPTGDEPTEPGGEPVELPASDGTTPTAEAVRRDG